MKKFVSIFSLAVVALLASIGITPLTASAAPSFVCNNTAADPLVVDDPQLHVVVEEGASCFIEDSVIHSLRADNPVDVVLLGSSLGHGVDHNVFVTGATGTVVVGNRGCGFDPKVGNNIMVRNSNNVLICQMSVDNNISVTGSHGRITVRESIACNNITASRNAAYDGTDPHPNAGAIRLAELLAANHITAEGNSGRVVLKRALEENFMSPSACRRMLK